MSTSKRSRAAHDVIRIDAGKKDRTTPMKLTPPVPAPMAPCLKVKVALGKDERGRERPPIWVEVANYPADGGLEAFYDLIHRAPDDGFMTADACATLSFASIVAIRRPKGDGDEYPVKVEPSPPGAPRRHYLRLKTLFGSGRQEIVEVANVPWNENGIAHFGRVLGKYRFCDFITTDFGFLPASGIKPDDLEMPDSPPRSRREKLRPEDILRPEDFPE